MASDRSTQNPVLQPAAAPIFVGVVLTCMNLLMPGGMLAADTVTENQHRGTSKFARVSNAALPNAIHVADGIISGGTPDGEAGFRALKNLGIKTVICVDGQKPDVETARQFELRYIHLPHGYDRIPQQRILELAKAIRTLPGPIYIHCHHGRHRSPAATAAACVAAGLINQQQAKELLKHAGTGSEYTGLYQSVRATKRVPQSKLESLRAEYFEVVELPPVVEVMTRMEQALHRIDELCSKIRKRTDESNHNALRHEALLLKEQLTEFARDPTIALQNDEFRLLTVAATNQAEQFEVLIAELRSPKAAPEQLKKSLAAIRANCTACHRKFRATGAFVQTPAE